MMMVNMAELTIKEQMFVEAYLQTWNGAEAARRAGYKHPDRLGSRKLKKPEIRDAIRVRMKAVAMDTDEALARLAEQARASLSDFIFQAANGKVGINWTAVRQRGHLLKAIKPTRAGITLEMIDQQAALRDILKHHGQLTDKSEATVSMIQMTLDEWKQKQAERLADTERMLAQFEDDDE